MKYTFFNLVNGGRIAIFFTGNLVVELTVRGGNDFVRILDGTSTNTGWLVEGTFLDVVTKLKAAVKL